MLHERSSDYRMLVIFLGRDLEMEFDEWIFGCGDDEESQACGGGKEEREKAPEPKYVPKNTTPEWFNGVDKEESGDCREEPHVIFKYRADLCYYRQQLSSATSLYLKTIEVLPSTNRVVHREVRDSLTRCYLSLGDCLNALSCAEELVTPPHDSDHTSWHLLALCYNSLGDRHYEDYVLCLQKCNLLQRHNPSTWLELANTYTSLSTDRHILHLSHSIFSNSEVTSHPEKPNFSNKDCGGGVVKDDSISAKNGTEKFRSILSNTVALFRPYFKWTTAEEKGEEERDGNYQEELVISSRLLGRQITVEDFVRDLHQLPWKRRGEVLRLLFEVCSQCCLIWARQLQTYSARHSGSFARQVETQKLEHIEHLIGCRHDNLTDYLIQCFNHPPIFEENKEKH